MRKERVEFKVFTNMSKNSIVDFKELITFCKKMGQERIVITDHNSVENFPKIYRYAKRIDNFKIIYGAVVDVLVNDLVIPITVIVRNKIGLKNLYKIISNIKEKKDREVITKKKLGELSEGLLYGLDALYMNKIYDDLTDEQVKEDMMWFDFIEVGSLSCVNVEDERKYVKRIINLARESRKLVIAVGNVCYLRKEDEVDYKVLFPKEDERDKYLKSTEEMLKEFSFLEDDKIVEEIVIDNTNKLADLVEDVQIVSDDVYLPKIENSKDIFKKMVYEKAYSLYGDDLPDIVSQRIEEELYGKDKTSGIINRGWEVIYLIYKKLVECSNDLGYMVTARGGVASSFVAYLSGLTKINPLPRHYRCPSCKESFFEKDLDSDGDLAALVDRECPKCHKMMIKDGFNISYEPFLGYDNDKFPKIMMNFSEDVQKYIYNCLKDIFGENHLFRAGTIAFNSKNLATTLLTETCEKNNFKISDEKKSELVARLEKVKRTNGIHPSGIFIIPKDKEVYDFTPINTIYDRDDNKYQCTHFDYHDLDKNIMKLDILVNDIPTMIKKLEDLTGEEIENIPLDDQVTMELINKGDVDDIPELDNNLARKIIKKIKPVSFMEVMKIIGICHMEGITLKDIDELLDSGIAFKEIIACRDDIMNYLVLHHMDKRRVYEIMEFVSTGKVIKEKEMWDKYKEEMQKLKTDERFINACSRIEFLLTKAQLVSYCLNTFRLAWYKVHFPSHFKLVIAKRDYHKDSFISSKIYDKNFVVVASCPLNGRMELIYKMIVDLGIKDNKSIHIFNYDGSNSWFTKNLIASISGIDKDEVEAYFEPCEVIGKLYKENIDRDAFIDAIELLQKSDIIMTDFTKQVIDKDVLDYLLDYHQDTDTKVKDIYIINTLDVLLKRTKYSKKEAIEKIYEFSRKNDVTIILIEDVMHIDYKDIDDKRIDVKELKLENILEYEELKKYMDLCLLSERDGQNKLKVVASLKNGETTLTKLYNLNHDNNRIDEV